MREDQFKDFRKDVKADLSVELLSELYDLTPQEVQKGITWHNRGILRKLYTALIDFFKNKVFQGQMRLRILNIRHLLRERSHR